MTELSVNISASERYLIKKVARERFYKTAKNRHPNPDFYEEISKQIYLESLEKLRPLLENDTIGFITHVINPGSRVHSHDFPSDKNVLLLENTDSFLTEIHSLSDFELTNINIPEEFISPGGKYPVCLGLYADLYGGIDLSLEVREKITSHNEKMDAIFSEMATQLGSVIDLIDKCTTTKAFNKSLPQLTALYPNSVKEKLRKKNAPKEHELTEEEIVIANASKAIAASALFNDKD